MELIVIVAILRFACADVSHLFNNQLPSHSNGAYDYTSQYDFPVHHHAETKVIPQYSAPEKSYELNLESTNLNGQRQTFHAPIPRANYESAQTQFAPSFAPAPSYHTLPAPHYSPEIQIEVAQSQFIPRIAPVRTSYQADASFSSVNYPSPIHHEVAQTQFVPQVVPGPRPTYNVPAAPTYHSQLPVYNTLSQAHPVAAPTQVFPQAIQAPAYHISAASAPHLIYQAPAPINDAPHHHHQYETAQTQFIPHGVQAPSSIYQKSAQTQIIPQVLRAPEAHFATASVSAPRPSSAIDYQPAASTRTGFFAKDGYHYSRY